MESFISLIRSVTSQGGSGAPERVGGLSVGGFVGSREIRGFNQNLGKGHRPICSAIRIVFAPQRLRPRDPAASYLPKALSPLATMGSEGPSPGYARLGFVATYTESISGSALKIADSLYKTTRAHTPLPSFVDARVKEAESKVAELGVPLLNFVQDRATHILAIVDVKVRPLLRACLNPPPVSPVQALDRCGPCETAPCATRATVCYASHATHRRWL